jgi:hypothetical protein
MRETEEAICSSLNWFVGRQSISYLPPDHNTVEVLRLLHPALIELEQGGILEMEHGKGRHENVIKLNSGVAGADVRGSFKILPDCGQYGVGTKLFSHSSPGGSGGKGS